MIVARLELQVLAAEAAGKARPFGQ